MQRFYKFILFLKGSFSIFEIFIGFFTLIFGYTKIQYFIFQLVSIELKEDSSDFIAGKILSFFQELSPQSEILIALYFIIEGIMKLFLIYGVYKDKKIIFPFAFFTFGALFFYEIFLLLNGHSWYISIFAILDALLLWVIYKEYLRISSKKH